MPMLVAAASADRLTVWAAHFWCRLRNTTCARHMVSSSIRRSTRKFPSPPLYGSPGNSFQCYGGTMAELTAVEKLKKWVADNLQTLQAAKVESIIGEYSGCGDEGNWESTSFEPAGAWEKLDEKLRNEVGELLESACGELESPGYEP